MLFDRRVNLEGELNRLAKIARNITSLGSVSKLSEFNSVAQKSEKAINRYLRNFGDVICPRKAALLESERILLSHLSKVKDPAAILQLMQNLSITESEFISISPHYLLRHPEKADATRTGPEMPGDRALTELGVKQAKEFADILIEELLIASCPVNLFLTFSPYKRTELFARIIKLKVEWMSRHFGKQVSVFFTSDGLISGDLVKVPKGMALKQWFGSDNAKKTSDLIFSWFCTNRSVSQRYTVCAGVTHLPNIGAFLTRYLKSSTDVAENFKYAHYIKLEDKKYFYDSKWH